MRISRSRGFGELEREKAVWDMRVNIAGGGYNATVGIRDRWPVLQRRANSQPHHLRPVHYLSPFPPQPPSAARATHPPCLVLSSDPPSALPSTASSSSAHTPQLPHRRTERTCPQGRTGDRPTMTTTALEMAETLVVPWARREGDEERRVFRKKRQRVQADTGLMRQKMGKRKTSRGHSRHEDERSLGEREGNRLEVSRWSLKLLLAQSWPEKGAGTTHNGTGQRIR